MSDNGQNDYYKITLMSEKFRKWDADNSAEQLTRVERMKMWELRFMLSIAQQLSMVAAHLGKIVGKVGDTK